MVEEQGRREPMSVVPEATSFDPQSIEKVRDVVGLNLAPPDRAIALCVDEKSQVQASDRSNRP